MIIQCLSCGKSVSSKGHKCPYCMSHINDMTLEMNGIKEETKLKERVLDLVFGFVHK
ncbi:MAG: hypothetical protein PHP74_04465 [Candidatus Gracilibacteria bacterium]|nr:hypothetical protein [Candidatus Gracilibacteria bacterium]